MASIATRVLREVLPENGCPTLMDPARGVGVRKQHAWLLWHGKIALSVDMLHRIHETFGVPVEVLLQVTRATPPKRRGRKLAQPPTDRSTSPEDDRSDRYGWDEDDVTITEPEEG